MDGLPKGKDWRKWTEGKGLAEMDRRERIGGNGQKGKEKVRRKQNELQEKGKRKRTARKEQKKIEWRKGSKKKKRLVEMAVGEDQVELKVHKKEEGRNKSI